MRNVTKIQRELIRLEYLPALDDQKRPNDDGIAGQKTLDAFNRFLASKGKPPITTADYTLTRLNLELFPGEQPPAPLPQPSIFDQIGTLVSILNLLKGKTMTSDQITGIIRLLIGLVGGYFVGKGIVSQSIFDWLSAGVLTAIPGVWSWISNRPKTIVPIASK